MGATFSEGAQFRRFLGKIEAHLACDILWWAYSHLSDDGEPNVSVDLDHTGLCNDAGTDGIQNTGCYLDASKKEDEECETYVALCDIEEGEEFICRYADFSQGEAGWEAL